MINTSELEFVDISTEKFRIYEFARGERVRIDSPLQLHVSKSGGHRIFDEHGISHYIPSGWIHLYWRAKPDQPNFVK